MWNGVMSVKRKINYIKYTVDKEEFIYIFFKWMIVGILAMVFRFHCIHLKE